MRRTMAANTSSTHTCRPGPSNAALTRPRQAAAGEARTITSTKCRKEPLAVPRPSRLTSCPVPQPLLRALHRMSWIQAATRASAQQDRLQMELAAWTHQLLALTAKSSTRPLILACAQQAWYLMALAAWPNHLHALTVKSSTRPLTLAFAPILWYLMVLMVAWSNHLHALTVKSSTQPLTLACAPLAWYLIVLMVAWPNQLSARTVKSSTRPLTLVFAPILWLKIPVATASLLLTLSHSLAPT